MSKQHLVTQDKNENHGSNSDARTKCTDDENCFYPPPDSFHSLIQLMTFSLPALLSSFSSLLTVSYGKRFLIRQLYCMKDEVLSMSEALRGLAGRLAHLGIIASVGFCYVIVFSLILFTNYCASCAGSQLWKYTAFGSSLVWIAFFYAASAFRPRAVNHAFRSVLSSSLLTSVVFTSIAIFIAPLGIAIGFGQAYSIVYFGSISFDFFSVMIVFVTATSGIISLEVGLMVHRAEPTRLESVLGKGNHWWAPALRRFSFLAWVVLLPTNFGDPNIYVKFSTLFMSALIVPAVYPLVEMVPRLRGFLSTYLGLGAVTILTLWNLFTKYPLVHPLLVMGFLSFLAGCLSSTVEDLGSYYLDIKDLSKREALFRLAGISFLVLLAVGMTWFYSHLAIFV